MSTVFDDIVEEVRAESDELLPEADVSKWDTIANGSNIAEEFSLTVKQEVTGKESLELQIKSETVHRSDTESKDYCYQV